MRLINYTKIILMVIALFAFASLASGQDTKPTEGQPQDVQNPSVNKPQDARGNMLRQLGLSKEQMLQIRMLNVERKPVMDAAQKRLREANRALDEAIYADNVSDADVQARLKEVHVAQAEVVRLRSMNELAVRRILTQEQLLRFRDLRRRFEQAARENLSNGRRPPNGQQVKQNFKNLPDGQQPVRPIARPNQVHPNF